MMTLMMLMAVIMMMMMINEKGNPHNIVSSKGKYMIIDCLPIPGYYLLSYIIHLHVGSVQVSGPPSPLPPPQLKGIVFAPFRSGNGCTLSA